jgi:subtilisin family serine protease
MWQLDLDRGAKIKIGVIDTGVGPHPYLDHIKKIGSILQGKFDPNGGGDVAGHGSHVSGIIGARPVEGSGEFCGVSCGAEVLMVRVFPENGGANQGDIAAAIDMLANEHSVDLINMSLGSSEPSQIELDAVIHAAEKGVLCISAAGNAFGQPILFPAGYPEVAAVSAIGLFGQYPAGSAASFCVPVLPAEIAGYLFVANFSNLGATLACTAPGVGIVSTVPVQKNGLVPAPYASMSGTSMASPLVTGCLASVLSASPQYLEQPRTAERASWASAALLQCLLNVGLDRNYVGGGLIQGAPSSRGEPSGSNQTGLACKEGAAETTAKQYVLARKREASADQASLTERLSAIPGVTVLSASADRAQIHASPEAIAKIHDQFSNDFHIEEVAPRSTQK